MSDRRSSDAPPETRFTEGPVCGMGYTLGLDEDEAAHRVYHNEWEHGCPFPGEASERILSVVRGMDLLEARPEDPRPYRKRFWNVAIRAGQDIHFTSSTMEVTTRSGGTVVPMFPGETDEPRRGRGFQVLRPDRVEGLREASRELGQCSRDATRKDRSSSQSRAAGESVVA